MRFIESWIPATPVATCDLTPSIRELLIKPDNFDGATYPVGSHKGHLAHVNSAISLCGAVRSRTMMPES
ncbi:hypothetical protein HU230_0027770 [Bradyrhizobium quebecense]|uniref:Uncharacterized protein n=1 Tax=Bradyrhizobium quebecense TaxID=2748629 RepID=A0A973WIT6_9BRAD|nr:hypothetical protein [Bradyrhizobium quebecense]UGA42114.1 hypothetical protein HU230_0027770 [Bradyrhizobium quebecense]